MLFFTGQKKINYIKRQVYAGGKSSYVQVATSTGIPVSAYLRPLSEEQAATNGIQWGLGFSLIVESGRDIREGDKLSIAATEYTVRGIVDHDRGGILAYRKCLATKPQGA